ncbi:MAG: hypothetical protein HY706_04075 [Candidatus Hydrogenedentes bacterium]|nr:hypothetical protein [Candidatus Hydrogenedentota bacterium]
MTPKNVTRRDFSKLAAAALCGTLVGATALAQEKKLDTSKIQVEPSLLLEDPNVCRGINTCQGKGKGDHACAGQSACATAKDHSCSGHNDCKGQGGCGGYPGQNTCKEKGHCAVPLSKDTWPIARKQFEHLMKDMGQKFGSAPKG